ncbi:MAG: protein translocase subunit SecF [Porticoccaceae bacterium]
MTTVKVINYMKWRIPVALLTLLLVIGSLVSLATKGMVMGLDFTGGTQIEVGFDRDADLGVVRRQLGDAGFENPVVVHFGSERDVLIKFQAEPDKSTEQRIVAALSAEGETVSVRRIEFVGPQVGEELRNDGGLGILVAFGLIMLYVSVRFQYKFAIGAVLGQVIDMIIVLGFFSYFELEFDLIVLAAMLAVIGYSLNDTIIVYDRIRENFRLIRDADPIQVINESLTQVLLRTIYTSLSTLLVLVALFYWGGELIHNFALALIIGVVWGTISSIYVAVNALLWLKIRREDLMQKVKEPGVDEFDGLP